MSIEEIYKLFEQSPRISTDSRNIIAGSLFFALRGASFDGNLFAVEALKRGAAYSVIESAEVLALAEAEYATRLILVDDVLRTLQLLARHHRRVLAIEILAITGSNGKTTTKELTLTALEAGFRVGATLGNLNNHIGVPLTLLSFDSSMQMAIVEMGASSCGEIAELCEIAEPNFGIITNIGRAHLDGFGGEAGVRSAKGELYDWLSKSGGVAFVARDSEVLVEMAGERPQMEISLYDYSLAEGVEHNLVGDYNRYNVAAAVAIARYFGVEEAALRAAIAEYSPSNNRSQRVETKSNTLVVDCYNANPSSMSAAIDNFLREPTTRRGGKALILGDMLELGEWTDSEHIAIIETISKGDFAAIYLVGISFANAYQELSDRIDRDVVWSFDDRERLIEHIDHSPLRDMMVLIKGSRSIRLEEIIKKL